MVIQNLNFKTILTEGARLLLTEPVVYNTLYSLPPNVLKPKYGFGQ